MANEMASGPGGPDPLRRTLDTLHLDPNAAADRPYLESMLRRLGYTEAQINAYLGRGPAAASAAPTASTVAEDTGAERQIEVEYTGAGLKEFTLVVGVDQADLPAIQAAEAGTEVFEAGPSMEEVDRLVAEGNAFDDFGGTAVEGGATSESEDDAKNTAPLEEAPAEGEAAAEQPEIPIEKGGEGAIPLPEGVKPGEGGKDFQTGEPLVEFQESRLNEAESTALPDVAAQAEELKAEGWEVADLQTGEFEVATWEVEEQVPEPGAGPFQHKDWTLYARDELRGETPQRIYFFAKGTPEGAEPASLPEGYEVAENPDTGRPFLRRASEGDQWSPGPIDAAHPSADPGQAPTKKRVRILRVRAASREEAIAKLQAEGRNVIASMPIDIEKRFGDES